MNRRYSIDPEHPSEATEVEALLAHSIGSMVVPQHTDRLRERLLQRVRRAGAAEAHMTRDRLDEGEWRPLFRGIRVKTLSAAQRAFLLDIEPGATLPVHRHHDDEECVVLRGEVHLADVRVGIGDYHRAAPGSRHGQVRSQDGALIYLRGTPIGDTGGSLRDLATALLPGRGKAPVTLRAGAGEWQTIAPGVESRTLFERSGVRSCMLRFAPGTALSPVAPALDQESLVIRGELYYGRTRDLPGDYRLAPANRPFPELSTEEGATVFVRGARIA